MQFLKLVQSVLAAVLFAAVLTFSASAGNGQGQDGNSQGQNQQGGSTRGAPGPVAGVGLMSVAVVGGYIWLVRRKRQGKAKKQPE